MSLNKNYAVFGLGRYGLSVAKELVRNGADVLAVDKDEELVNMASVDLPICRVADVTDSEVLDRLGISQFDVVIIAMATSFEASIMATVLCKEAGVGKIIVKCASQMHRAILEKVGADTVVLPEIESGMRLAKNLLSSDFVDMMELSGNVSMVELQVKSEWDGRSLIELDLRRKYSVNVVAILQNDDVIVNIDPAMPLSKDMKLIVIADTTQLLKLKK